MMLTKEDLLQVKHVQVFNVDRPKRIKIIGVSTDSGTLERGKVFVAIRGENFDGHNFITKAVEQGAITVIVEKGWSDTNGSMVRALPVPALVVENAVHALGQLAKIYRRRFRIPILAVGGSNGKTTTKDMIAQVLEKKYRVLKTEGNLNNHIGIPQTLFRLEKKHRFAVIEIGTNHFGEISYLCEILEPTHGLITNIAHEHLEFFRTLEGVAKAECELFDWLSTNRATSAVAFVNRDDHLIPTYAKQLKKTVTYGIQARSAHVKGSVVSVDRNGRPLIEIKTGEKKTFKVQLSIPGHHNAMNALTAATVGLTFRVPVVKIQKALETFQAVDKRMQIEQTGGIKILNDTYNSNPDSVLGAFETLNSIKSTGKKIAVLADMLELGNYSEEAHRNIGEAAHKFGIEYLLTYGPLSKHTHEAARVKFKSHYDQKNILAEYLAELVSSGDVVLIKGSRGMKMEDIVAFLRERLKQAA